MRVVYVLSVLLLVGCGEATEPAADTRRCVPPAGVDASPNSLMDVIALIDSLPHPVDVACFVESLERPLKVIGSTSTFSAQPAQMGAPRIFGVFDSFIASWVPASDGSGVLEFAEERPNARSVKAEIRLPVEDAITPAHFEHVLLGSGTACGGCHLYEEPSDIEFGRFFQSEALRPASSDTVRVNIVRELHEACDPAFDEERCEIFEAMFGHGEVVDTDFPRVLPTIYD